MFFYKGMPMSPLWEGTHSADTPFYVFVILCQLFSGVFESWPPPAECMHRE